MCEHSSSVHGKRAKDAMEREEGRGAQEGIN